MTQIRILFLAALIAIIGIPSAQAEETEQFSLPPGELIDLGPISSRILYTLIESILTRINADIQPLLPREKQNRHVAARLEQLRNDFLISDRIFDKTGPGFPRWLRENTPPETLKQAQFREVWPWNNAYWLVFSQSPSSVLELSPTVNMYGAYVGTDKLGHFFMQGHTYFKIYSHYIKWGKTAEQAHAAMIAYGQLIEQTYLGTLINGIYSNADLSANYAGWKFYMNLTHSIKVGDKTLPPMLVFKNNKWEFAKHVTPDNLLKPFFSDHLSEAWNPCRYSFSRNQIRKQVKKRCPAWINRYGITHDTVETKLKTLARWHGEDYGYWLPAKQRVSLDTCFGGR